MHDLLYVVSARGFEPPRPFGHQLLRLARLPFRHADYGNDRAPFGPGKFSILTGSILSAVSKPKIRERKYSSPSNVRRMFLSCRKPCCSPSYATYAYGSFFCLQTATKVSAWLGGTTLSSSPWNRITGADI